MANKSEEFDDFGGWPGPVPEDVRRNEDRFFAPKPINPMLRGRDWYDSFVDKRMNLGTGGLPMLPYCGLALCGEAGEFAEKVKKCYRDDSGEMVPDIRLAMVKELGDALFYLTKAAHVCGFSLEGVKEENQKKLMDRDARGTRRGSGDER